MLPAALRAAIRPKKVDVVIPFGASQSQCTLDSVTELPNGYFTTDPRSFIWDRYRTNSIVPLVMPTFATVTISNASPAVVTWTGHGRTAGEPLGFETTVSLPTGIATLTRYFVKTVPDANSFTISLTDGGAAVNTSSAGSGTHTCVANGGLECQPLGTGPDGSYPNSVGWCCDFLKQYRRRNPASKPVYFFVHREGGSRFTDAGSRGRAANFSYNLTDGAKAAMYASWQAFVAALAMRGEEPNIILVMDDSIGNGAADLTGVEPGNYETDMSNLEARVRLDIVHNAKWVHCRLSSQMTALNATQRGTIRTGQQNIVAADPTHDVLLQCDGLPVESDNLHDKANALAALGRLLAYEAANRWHPLKEWGFLGGNQTTHLYLSGDFRNGPGATAFTLSGGNVQAFWDCVDGSLLPNQTTDANRPTINVSTLADGYVQRFATGNGSTQGNVTASGTPPITASGDWCVYGVVKGPATANKFFFGEGGTGTNPFIGFGTKGDGSGNFIVSVRDDSGVLTTLDFGIVAFNNVRNFFAIWKSGSTWMLRVNGTTSTGQTLAPGTTTLNRTSLFALNSNGGVLSSHMAAEIGLLGVCGVPDTAFLDNAQGFCQLEFGTV